MVALHLAEKREPAMTGMTVLLWVQGTYFFLTGAWPLISIRTFQQVTGPKTDHLPSGHEADHWLVMTVGVLITAIALAILTAAWRQAKSPETVVLAVSAAIGLLVIDVVYVSRGVIAPIYLVDAGLESLFLLAWSLALLSRFANSGEPVA